MNNPNLTKMLVVGMTALTVTAAFAETPSSLFRVEAPVDRDVAVAPADAANIGFRESSEFSPRSAVAVTSAGVGDNFADNKDIVDGKFVPTLDAGEGNFQKRPYRFTFSLNQGYDDNIYTSSFDEQSSFFTSASLGASIKLSDGRTSLEASLNAGGSYYWDRDDSFDPDISLNVDFSHVFSPKLRLDITSYLAYQSEPDFQTGFGQNRRNGDYFYGNIGFNLTQTFSRRFSAVYGYTVAGVYYDESDTADIENRLEQTFSLQLRYLVQPTISLVAEYRYGLITYDAINRDSNSNYALAGLDFTLNRRLTASLRAGAQFRDSDDQGTETSPFVESTLTYKYGARSSIQWFNRYGFEESDLGIGTTRQTYRTGLTVSQQFSSRISANGGVFFTTSDYDNGLNDEEQTLDLSAGLVYSVNRFLALQAGYTYSKVYSDNDFREYDRNRIYTGATISF